MSNPKPNKRKGRRLPEPILLALRAYFPKFLGAAMYEGGGKPAEVFVVLETGTATKAAERYIPDERFLAAVRVCDTGDIEAMMLLAADPKGFMMSLQAPREVEA